MSLRLLLFCMSACVLYVYAWLCTEWVCHLPFCDLRYEVMAFLRSIVEPLFTFIILTICDYIYCLLVLPLLYLCWLQVIQEKQALGGAGQLFSSDRTYVMPGKADVQVSINPDDLEHQLKDKDQLREAYEAQLASGGEGGLEDFEDDARGKRKRRMDASNVAKRYKDFKF